MRRRRVTVTGVALALILLVGCTAGPGPDDDDQQGQVETVDARPAMDEVLDRYDAMQRDMVEALDAELPGLTWQVNDGGLGLVRSGCGDEGASATAEEVSMLKHSAPGTLPAGDWHRAVELVQAVGEEYGFATTTTVVDRADDLEVVGEDGFGARYRFGMAVNTILSVTTGCHEWDSVPDGDYERPSPLVG